MTPFQSDRSQFKFRPWAPGFLFLNFSLRKYNLADVGHYRRRNRTSSRPNKNFAVNHIGNDWMRIGKFEPTEAKSVNKFEPTEAKSVKKAKRRGE